MKELILTFLFFLISLNLLAEDGLSIKNSFQVDAEGQVFRGREPKSKIGELKTFGITDVIIFKNGVKDEVEKEEMALKSLDINSYHIPFLWKDVESPQLACEQVVEALEIIKKVKSRGGKVYFHCTAGEDRTGILAGLYRMQTEGLPMQEVFESEMCARGYADGNPQKPLQVYREIHTHLTPLFVALAEKIEKGHLTRASCKRLQVKPSNLECR